MTPNLTTAGKNLLLRALAGEQIIFTKVQLGDGAPQSADSAVGLMNMRKEISISSITVGDSYVTLTTTFSNNQVPSGFRITEAGFFAQDPDDSTQEILYALGNEPESSADYVPPASNRILEMQYDALVFIGDAENVSAAINSSLVYTTKAEFDAHLADNTNPHGTDATDVGLGNVPNVTTNNQTLTYNEAGTLTNITSGERLYLAFGKIKKAISSLISHIGNRTNPHGVTPVQIGAASSSHTHAAGDISSGTMAVNRGGTGKNNWAANGLIYANSATGLTQLPVPAAESVLTQNDGIPSWKNIGSLGNRTTKYVVGTSATGWTAANCDYLCTGINDQEIINMALAALPTTGGTVLLLDGTYNIAGNISLCKARTTLKGAGAAEIKFNGPYVISVDADNCTVREISLLGLSSNAENTCGISAVGRRRTMITHVRGKITRFYFENCRDSIIKGNFVGESNGYNKGIQLKDGNGNLVSDNNTSEAYYGIYAENEKHISIIGNMNTCTNECGIYCTGCKNITLTGNMVYSNVGGFTTGCSFNDCELIVFSNNTVWVEDNASGNGVNFSSCTKYTIQGNMVKNLVQQYALYISSCSYGSITGNMLNSTNSSYALYITGCSSTSNYYNYTFTVSN